jgi:hypothetical protein
VKVLLVTMYFPPSGGGGVQRALKFATHLPELGIETHVLAPDDPKWVHRDDELLPPMLAWVHRARYIGPKGRKPAEELHGTQGLERWTKQAQLAGRRSFGGRCCVLPAQWSLRPRRLRKRAGRWVRQRFK